MTAATQTKQFKPETNTVHSRTIPRGLGHTFRVLDLIFIMVVDTAIKHYILPVTAGGPATKGRCMRIAKQIFLLSSTVSKAVGTEFKLIAVGFVLLILIGHL